MLVIGCIEAKFCKKICVGIGKLSPRSTQCTPLHRSLISIFSSKIAKLFSRLNNFPIFYIFSSSNFAFFCEFLMKFCPDFATNSRKESRVSLFQSNLRKQIRKLPKILKSRDSVKTFNIHYYAYVSLGGRGSTSRSRRSRERSSSGRARTRWPRSRRRSSSPTSSPGPARQSAAAFRNMHSHDHERS